MTPEKLIEKKIGAKVTLTPIVSVIIPAYNVGKFISDTLNSVLTQTYRIYEIILVNDGSPDTPELEVALKRYFNKIIYIKQPNEGVAAARNIGIKNARGNFLAFLDGDDIWLPEYLESQLNALKEKQCDLIYCDAKFFGSVRDSYKTFMKKSPSHGEVTTESLIGATCNVITSGTLVKREVIIEAGMFDEMLPRIGMEDFDLWFRLVRANEKLCYQRKVLLNYRVRPDSLSGSNVQRAEREITALNIIEQKHALSEQEKTALEKQRKKAVAVLEIEKGKYNLVRGNYKAARENIMLANRYYRKLKLAFLTRLLKFQPHIAQKLYQTISPAEYSFISHNGEDQKR